MRMQALRSLRQLVVVWDMVSGCSAGTPEGVALASPHRMEGGGRAAGLRRYQRELTPPVSADASHTHTEWWFTDAAA